MTKGTRKAQPPLPAAAKQASRDPNDVGGAALRVQRRMLIANFIVAAVTAAYVMVTLLQYFAFKEQIAEARRSADAALSETRSARKVDQRAWLGVKEILSSKDMSTPVLAKLSVLNSGKTPAMNVRLSIVADLLLAGNDDVIDDLVQRDTHDLFPTASAADGFIYPNSSTTTDVELIDQRRRRRTLTEEQVSRIAASGLTVYVHGRVEYRDIFNSLHWLTCCYRWEQDKRDFVACDRGNASDDIPRRDRTVHYFNLGPKPIGEPSLPSDVVLTNASLMLLPLPGYQYPRSGTKIHADLLSTDGTVIGRFSPRDVIFDENPWAAAQFHLLSHPERRKDLYLRLVTDPTPTQGFGGIQWTFNWADEAMTSGSLGTRSLPQDTVWPLFHVNPGGRKARVEP